MVRDLADDLGEREKRDKDGRLACCCFGERGERGDCRTRRTVSKLGQPLTLMMSSLDAHLVPREQTDLFLLAC